MRRLLLLVLLAGSFLYVQAQSITVNTPNGGEVLYACQTYTITWSASGTSNFYDIDYSLNNGAIWASVATNLNVTNGQFVWTVPNVQSSTCLVRVRDKNNNTIEDVSNAVFSIRIPITLTSPNGGEVWQAGSQRTISWNHQGTSQVFSLFYSTNGGSTFSVIAANESSPSGTYNWTVPNTPSTNCIVRVWDFNLNCMRDDSDNPFTITPAQPVLNFPNGGQSLSWGQTINITWDAATFYSPVRLEYSTDNGLTWTVITTSTTNDGSQSWTVPSNINSTQCLIKASNTADVTSNDVSNAVFSILAPRATIVTPNGGETWLACENRTISYTTSGTTNLASFTSTVSYSTNGGSTWTTINSVSGPAANPNSVAFTVPDNISSTNCLVRVITSTYPTISDTSDAVFSIQPQPLAITVTSPNGGEVLPALSNTTITWTNTAAASGLYDVAYSSNNGTTWTTLATAITGNAYNWTNIPNTPSTTYLVRVRDNANSCRQDVSNANFTVTAPQPILTFPNGGQTFSWGQSINITWNSSTFFSTVRLEYSTDNGLTWTVITTSTTNDGTQSWIIPSNINSTQCLVRASNTADLNINDVSDAVFSILAPRVTLVLPNGGETWLACESKAISYFTTGAANLASYTSVVSYSINGGSTWTTISSVSGPGSNPVNVAFTVPDNISSTNCLVRVTTATYPTLGDTTDAVFSIQPQPLAITVTSPNGGEVLPALSNTTITWTNTAAASGLYDVAYSSNNGTTWTTLATAITGNAYNWTNIPNSPGTTYLVRVRDNANTCRQDVSNANFTITAPQPILTFPNGGQSFSWGQSINITWNASTFFSTVRLEYSIDNGLTWTVITTSTTNDGTQAWTIPSSVNSTQCLIRASNTADLNIHDVSDAVFSILAPKATIITPNGGETWLACENRTISYTTTGVNNLASFTSTVSYSTNGGSTWTTINSVSGPAANPNSVAFTVPDNISSTNCLVRVITSTFPTISDTSDAVFSIQPQPQAITVTSPNGGEVLPALSNTTITWTNTAAASGLYDVAYSSNNGTTWTTLATAITGNAYNWTNIPNTPSTTYLVRVRDNANSCRQDVSNANFTVTAPQPILTFPNGGQTFSWGQSINITWNASTFFSTVRLEYSTDNGLTWTVITTSTTNDGTQSWVIPSNINSTQCLVRASNTSDLNINDVSDAVFSILAPRATLVLPNGGETWLACESKSISYFTTGATNLASYTSVVSYSINGGSTWTTISSVSGPGSNPVNVAFTVPDNISSTNCLVRVTTATYPTLGDTTDAVFSIQPQPLAITVTSPNGGEVLPALSNTTITWTNTAAASGLYDVAYSSNNGTTWTTLATAVTGNAYNWTNIPNSPGTTYLVRVRDNANSCRQDVSNANFTVTAPQPILTFPNGGQTFGWGQSINITWNASTFFSTVRLEYSTDNGTTWNLITSSTTNDGTQSWIIPSNINSTQCLVKASNTADLSSFDISDAVFSILAPRATITSPIGGENWLACENRTISFNTTGTTNLSSFSSIVSYSTNGGLTWNTISSVTGPTANPNNVAFTVPDDVSSANCLVRVVTSTFPTISDTSDAVFTIQPQPQLITVTSPNGGEVLTGLSTRTITWTNQPGTSGLYNIAYSINNGATFTTIATGVSGNAYNWTVPNISGSTNCLIRVRDNAVSCRQDVSDANFTIQPAQPILTSPNGGEVFWSGNAHNITWNTAAFYTTVRLEYSLDQGATWTLITASTTNDGTQSWTIPNVGSTRCLVRASNSDNLNSNDVSDAVFTINPAVTVLTPTGGDSLGACTQTTISFQHSPVYTSFDIEYTPNGISWFVIATNQTFGGTTGSYNWTVANLPTQRAFVRVYPTGSLSLADQNDSAFTIKPSVSLWQPNYGGTLVAGSVFPIKWNSDGISNLYNLSYSTTGSSGPWINIVTGLNTSTNVYDWTVPASLSTNCYIRIVDNVNSCKRDDSNLPFTIANTPQPITVTQSNGLDTVFGCQNYTIRWTEPGTPIGTYNIDWSTNGSTWTNIVSNHATTSGSYHWIVPNVQANTALIRVSSSSNSAIFDASDAAFTIAQRQVLANPDTLLCAPGAVQLSATGGLGTFTWSPAIGLSNPNIANPIATVSATQQYVVTSSNGTCTITDTVRMTVAQPIAVSVEVGTPVVCAGTTARFNARVTGAAAASYQWRKNNVIIPGADSVLNVTDALSTDVFTCSVSSAAPCVSSATSNGVSTIVYQALRDTTVTSSCIGCTVNLNNAVPSNYPTNTWNTANPSSARVGIYSLIGVGGSCRDTAIAYVNAPDGSSMRGCATSNFILTSNLTGNTYQWQQNTGFGWTNVSNNVSVNGLRVSGAGSSTLRIGNGTTSLQGVQFRCIVDGTNLSDITTIKVSSVWTGAVSSAWNVAGNWSCGVVPDVNTDVFIYSGTPNNLVVTAPVICRSVHAASGAVVTVNTGAAILLSGK